MADTKISGLTAQSAALATDDLLVVVDTSDTEVLFVHVDSCRNIALTTPAPTTDDKPFEAAKGRKWSAADFLSTVG